MLYSAENGAKELCQAFSKLATRSSVTHYYICSEYVRKSFRLSSQAARDTTHRHFTLWVCLFTDPTLQALIERGLKQNSNMKNAELRIKEADYAL